MQEPESRLAGLIYLQKYDIDRGTEPREKEIPHWLRHSIVGPDFARECVQIHYETITFVIGRELPDDVLYLVEELLNTDYYGLNVHPANYMRSIQISFIMLRFVENSNTEEKAVVRKQFELLATLKQVSAKVKFRMAMKCDWGEPQRLFVVISLLQFLRPHFEKFKRRELKFTFWIGTGKWGHDRDWRDITYLCDSPDQLDEWGAALCKYKKLWGRVDLGQSRFVETNFEIIVQRYGSLKRCLIEGEDDFELGAPMPSLEEITLPGEPDYDMLKRILM
jgi:hypothetical protein